MISFISTADWHLREDVPRCRVETQEEWVEHQLGRLLWISDKAHELGAQFILASGDLFHRPRCPEWFLNRIIAVMRQSKVAWVIEPGNHDMDKRDPDMGKTSYGILDQMAQLQQGETPLFVRARDFIAVVSYNEAEVSGQVKRPILTMHVFLQKPGDSNVHVSGTTPRTLLAKYPDHKAICVGDHHAHFSYEREGRVVVNPGALTIQNVELKDQPMGVFLVEVGDTAKATSIPFPADTAELVDDAYIELDKDREGRLAEFQEKMAGVESSAGSTLDFEARVLTRIQELRSNNQMEESVEAKVKEYIGHGAKE